LVVFFSLHALFLNILFPFKVNVEYSKIVTSSNGTILHAYLTSDDKWRMKTELNEISPELKKAIIHKEDRFFKYHFGVNPIAITRALLKNTFKQKRTSGASTITMQVVRLLEPRPRTYRSKVIEMFRAMQLEMQFSKMEILQLYLNLVPYGSNIEGVKSASVLYFDKAPNHLSIAEITALSIIPNRPNTFKPGPKNNDYLAEQRNYWLNVFKEDRLFDTTDINDAIAEPLQAYRRDAPKLAPHFCYRMLQQYPQLNNIQTNLNIEDQATAEKITEKYVNRLYNQNITNAAVLIINNKTNQVVSYLGSADFNNNAVSGQVDGIRAVRAPGSTLKPLIYGMAFEKGLATPMSTITDVPVNYAGYSPVNFDRTYHGKVTAERALANSLNVPAVKMLGEVGTKNFINLLTKSGFKQIEKDKKKLGLSLALGGCGVTLEELTNLYTSFASNGNLNYLKWLKEDTVNLSIPVLNESANFMVTKVLTKLQRPDLPNVYAANPHVPKIAWKTGTSYGRRDAWSIGYNADYTIGVWVGNFNGKGTPELTGADIATPLLFQLFHEIDPLAKGGWVNAPASVKHRTVCSETGMVPSKTCENKIIATYIPTVSSNQKCNHQQYVWVNAEETHSHCTACILPSTCEKKLYPNHKPELLAYYDDNYIPYTTIPPHNPNCERVFKKNAPFITSPVNGLEYILQANDTDELMLACNANNDVSEVHWFIDNKFYATTTANEPLFFNPKRGNIKISCTDDKGRNTDIEIDVVYLN